MGKGALAAAGDGQLLAWPHDMLLQPLSSVAYSSGHTCALPSPAISSWGPYSLCASLLGLNPSPVEACASLRAWGQPSQQLLSALSWHPGEGEGREAALGKGRLHGKRGRKQLSQGRSHFSFVPVYPCVNRSIHWPRFPFSIPPQLLIPGRRRSGKARETDSFSKTARLLFLINTFFPSSAWEAKKSLQENANNLSLAVVQTLWEGHTMLPN